MKEYTLYVNGQETTDLLNPKVKPLAAWHVFKNIYSNNELVFDPSLYSLINKESEINVEDTLQQYQFKQMVNEINLFEKKLNEVFKKRPSNETASLILDTLITENSIIEDKYPLDISQLIIEKQIYLLVIKSLFLDSPQGKSNNPEFENKRKEYFLGEEFGASFIKINGLINKLDPNIYLLKGDFIAGIKPMQDLLTEYPELASKNNLSENYYDEFSDNFIEKSPNKKLCYSILYNRANMFRIKDEAKTIAIFNELKSNPQYAEFIDIDLIDRQLNEMNIKLWESAPNFSVDLLNGKKLNLSDFSGKYVFIDFWGSWCAPCRQEIPNIKKLYSSLSRDKLEIIGLAQDDETKLRNYIKEQNIEYPNALAPKEILIKYGISRFPTSFLINPKGKIVKKDVRGADAMELLKKEIDDYFN